MGHTRGAMTEAEGLFQESEGSMERRYGIKGERESDVT